MNPPLVILFLALGAWQAKPNVPPSPAAKERTVQKGNSQHQADNPQKEEADKSQETVRTSGLEKARPETEAQENCGKKQSCNLLYRAYLLATIVGVCGGLVGLYFIWRQIGAAKSSADAAIKNAEALMNAERAWVGVAVRGTGDGWRPDNNAVEIALFNFGKTPAMIKELVVKAEKVRSIQDVKGSAGEGTILEDMKDVLLAPAERFEIPIEVDQSMSRPVAVRGIVKYCDVNRRSWCTRFLYLCDYVRLNEPVIFRRIPHGYYNSYGEGYESQNEGQGNIDSNPL